MGYLMELDDLRSRIKHPPEVPPPAEAWCDLEAAPETEAGAASAPEPPAGSQQQELELTFDEPGR